MAYTYTNEWNITKPENSTLAGYMAQHMRNLKVDVQERLKAPQWPSSWLYKDNGNVSGAVTIDMDDGNVHIMTLTGDVTSFTINNIQEDRFVPIILIIKQDATGGRSFDFGTVLAAATFQSNYDEINTEADGETIVELFTVDQGTSYYAQICGWY